MPLEPLGYDSMYCAGAVGFEPTEVLPSLVFKTSAIVHSTKHPLRVRLYFPRPERLQPLFGGETRTPDPRAAAAALPLNYTY